MDKKEIMCNGDVNRVEELRAEYKSKGWDVYDFIDPRNEKFRGFAGVHPDTKDEIVVLSEERVDEPEEDTPLKQLWTDEGKASFVIIDDPVRLRIKVRNRINSREAGVPYGIIVLINDFYEKQNEKLEELGVIGMKKEEKESNGGGQDK